MEEERDGGRKGGIKEVRKGGIKERKKGREKERRNGGKEGRKEGRKGRKEGRKKNLCNEGFRSKLRILFVFCR